MFEPLSAPVGRIIAQQGRTIYETCPCCGQKNALAVTTRDGKKLAHCFYGCPQDSLWRVMRGERPQIHLPPLKPRPASNLESVAAFVRKLWGDSQPAAGTDVETYLRGRGLAGTVPPSLRYLPDHPHKPSGTRWPVMLASVTDSAGRLQAIHRTYLVQDGTGKAPVTPPKMTLGQVGGLSCHLAPAGEELIVAEGIETALTVMQSTNIPAWAALSAGGIINLVLPPLPLAASIVIAADNDTVGLNAARQAADRWREDGRCVKIATPPAPHNDFNDVLMESSK